LFSEFLCLFRLEGTFASFFKDKKSKKSHKTVEIKVSYPDPVVFAVTPKEEF
jgi:hypothetical protein